jgi:DNA repair ATPase RecN
MYLGKIKKNTTKHCGFDRDRVSGFNELLPNKCKVATTQTDINLTCEACAQTECSAEELDKKTLTILSLETSNEDLTRTVERLEKEIALKNKTMDDILELHSIEIHHLQKKFLDDHREFIGQNRAMRDELQSYKEKRDDLKHARPQMTSLRSKHYKETAELQRTVDQLANS